MGNKESGIDKDRMNSEGSSLTYRIEKDTMGEIKVPIEALWGAQTQRSLMNFQAGPLMPPQVITAFVCIKKAAAKANGTLGVISDEKMNLICDACEQIEKGGFWQHFPLVVYQTGSGTQTNMNVNEVIANLANDLAGEKLVHPNDDVNKSQSSNDVFPSAMHIAASSILAQFYVQLEKTKEVLAKKEVEFKDIIKTGRTHLQDATPLTLGQEIGGWRAMTETAMDMMYTAGGKLRFLPLGGTAVGTGLNAPEGFDKLVIKYLNEDMGFDFIAEENKFHGLSSKDGISFAHSGMRVVAESFFKIANDVRWLASGPRCGIGEINIPANEPGSSIMPGKVNPTQCEALTMAAIKVIGNDSIIAMANSNGNFQLNTYMPLIIDTFIESGTILYKAIEGFTEGCLAGITPNAEKIEENLEKNLMLVTALTGAIGYENGAKIAKKAFEEGITLKEAAIKLGLMTEEEFNKRLNPANMV